MHGSSVKRLQELGDLIGFDGGPNDGIYGPDTTQVVKDIQTLLGLVVDGICGPKTWDALCGHVDKLDARKTEREVVATFDNYTIPIYNRIGLHPHPKWYAWQRSLEDITGITLHQTGCRMPKKSTGWDRLNAHVGITSAGKIIIVNDFRDMIWHAQKLSHSTIGVEFEGNYPGLINDPATLWRGGGPGASLTAEQISAGRVLFMEVFAKFRGEHIKHVFGHRQSSATRPADPGQDIWQNIGLEWRRFLQANQTDGNKVFGNGRPIPYEWDDKQPNGYKQR